MQISNKYFVSRDMGKVADLATLGREQGGRAVFTRREIGVRTDDPRGKRESDVLQRLGFMPVGCAATSKYLTCITQAYKTS